MTENNNINNLDTGLLGKVAFAMKLKILEMAHKAFPAGAHVGGALSCVETLAVLTQTARLDGTLTRDRIILSKAHGALALYTALWQKGLLADAELETFDRDPADDEIANGKAEENHAGDVTVADGDGRDAVGERDSLGLFGHPRRDVAKGLEFAGGSLGLGISYAVGQAYALRQMSAPASEAPQVYCIVGDGELDEGMVWEALMSAANFHLDNLTVIVDCNKGQLDGQVDEVMNLGNLRAKFEAFGFDTLEIDGHNLSEILTAVSAPVSGRPKAIIANTVKGNGVDFLTNTKESHFGALSAKKYEKAVAQITQLFQLGNREPGIGDWKPGVGNRKPEIGNRESGIGSREKEGKEGQL